MNEIKNDVLDKIILPEAPEPLGLYSPVSEFNGLIFLSGMLPIQNAEMLFVGKVVDKKTGYEAARLAAMVGLSVLKKRYKSLSRINRVIQASVYIAADADFQDHAFVADGCSELLGQVYPERHSRLVFGVSSLPKNASIELGLIFELREEKSKQ